ncbi:hypothetical protein [uncultured Gammaproteobacteria bacterium]|nr:hypothetical protein [uncultured Gammaproteobacteria bacterium]
MCWYFKTALIFYWFVSVAGCLGYDVLVVMDFAGNTGRLFQLLVV